MQTIKRDIYVTKNVLQAPIEVTEGTNSIAIEFDVRDYDIPASAAAVAYSLSTSSMEEPNKALADVSGNKITIIPSETFFLPGQNVMQIRIIDGNSKLISFNIIVKCTGKMRFGDEKEEQQSTLVEQMLAKLGEYQKKSASPYNFKGSCLSSELPASGNTINDTYYCTDLKYRKTWNGSAWEQSSLNEADYEDELTKTNGEVSSLKEDLTKITSETIYANYIEHEYIDYDDTNGSGTGEFIQYEHWNRTDYINVENVEILLVESDTYKLCCWYNDRKEIIYTFGIYPSVSSEVTIPPNAKYVIISFNKMHAPSISIKKYRDIQGDINGLPTMSKVKNIPLKYVGHVYIQAGKTFNGNRWCCTDYVEIPNNMHIVANVDAKNAIYNSFYDENKTFISDFDVRNYTIPDNAKYMRISHNYNESVKVYDYKPTIVKLCSWNVGMWVDGIQNGVRDENIESASLVLRRFVGKNNFDLMFLEEAPWYFDTKHTINAYQHCIKNNLQYEWNTTDSTVSLYGRMILACGKYKISNVEIKTFASGSKRAFVTFDVDIDGIIVKCIIAHLSFEENSSGVRQQDIQELISYMDKHKYCILTGDFNTYSISEFDVFATNYNLANHGYYGDFETWPHESRGWNKCLDNIICSKNIKITNVELLDVDMSDHTPLVATLEIN
ncbi:MAG: endonuclease/exonuclease/phosphatase family protein [Lachnospiraceae bacterium]|nr:endonuclease/exonuclease/phosphatase family protein [Lachnospiraceae bacterium]